MNAAAAAYNRSTEISAHEIFYRRVLPEHLKRLATGDYVLSSNAFSDRHYEPSIDREAVLQLMSLDAEFTRWAPENGVASLKAGEVRKVRDIGRQQVSYECDIHPAPVLDDPATPDNPAHCVVRISPINDDIKWAVRKLNERLSKLAKIELIPQSAP